MKAPRPVPPSAGPRPGVASGAFSKVAPRATRASIHRMGEEAKPGPAREYLSAAFTAL